MHQQVDVLTQVLNTLRLSTLVYGRFELGAPWGIRVPGVNAAHLYVVSRGGAELTLDANERPVTLAAGDVALLPHGGPHTLNDGRVTDWHTLGGEGCNGADRSEPLRIDGGGARTSIVAGAFLFDSLQRNSLFQRLPKLIHVPAASPSASPLLALTVQLFVAETSSTSPGAPLVVSRLADVLLIQALRTHISDGTCPQKGLQAIADTQVGKALTLMHEKPEAPWTVESLASAVGVSRSGFAARFAEILGEPPLAYLTSWRMTRAAELLRGEAGSMSAIAERVGYQSEASFNRAFKRHAGTTPGSFRRRGGGRPSAGAQAIGR